MIAWTESQDSATLVDIAAVTDDILTPSGTDRFFVPNDYRNIYWGAALGTAISRAKYKAPSLETRQQDVEILPRSVGADAFSLDQPQIFLPQRPIPLASTDSLGFQAAEDGAGADQLYGVAVLGPDQPDFAPNGDILTARGTGTTTLTANAWSTVTITLETDLEPGRYALVGAICISATAIVARAIITGQNYRPGFIGLAGTEATAADYDPAIYSIMQGLSYGEFTHVDVPQFQFLAAAADTAQTVLMKCIRIGDFF
jgi:hypothetical protein